MGLEKKSEPPPREMWPSLPRATSFLGAASSSTSALNANRLGAGPAHPAHPNQFHTVPKDSTSPRAYTTGSCGKGGHSAASSKKGMPLLVLT